MQTGERRTSVTIAQRGDGDVQGRTYLYQQLAADIRARVAAGEFDNGVLLPSEGQLAEAYSVSRLTVKRALDGLRRDGLLEARRGLGWFVAKRQALRQGLGQLTTIDENIRALGMTPVRKVLEFAFVDAPPEVRERLGADRTLRIVRLNLADGEPVAHVTTYCAEDLAGGLSKTSVEQSTVYELLPVEIAAASHVIRAGLVDDPEASLLHVAPGSPGLWSERITYDSDERAVLFSLAVFPADRAEYVVELRREGQEPTTAVRVTPSSDPG